MRAIPSKPLVQDDLRRCLCVIFVVGAWDSLSELREVVYDDQKSCVPGFGFADFQGVKLYQIIDVATVFTLQE